MPKIHIPSPTTLCPILAMDILFWNANGLISHKNELITILNEKRIDIAFDL